jgi:iron complex transport system substrate-binding protein
MDPNEKHKRFSQYHLASAIQIWNLAVISLIDIRYCLISSNEAICGYRLPTSTFLYIVGKAEVSLSGTVYHTERFGLFHAGKGAVLSIQPTQDWLEYYMVLYKTGEPPFHKREFHKLIEHTNPFRQQYGFAPENTVFFAVLLRKMYERWKHPTSLNLFYGKAAFYQFVYEVCEELEKGNVFIFEPDVVSMAMRYLDRQYNQQIAIQEMCSMLGVSYSHFHRLFKQKTTKTPQEYLIHTRLNAAREWLSTSNASIQEVATHCGFIDASSFYRLFMKSEGIAPGMYRQLSQSHMRDCTIENVHSFPYNEKDSVSLSKLIGKGENYMFKQMRSKTVIAALTLLLLSACSTAPSNTGSIQSTPTSAVTSQVTETEAIEPMEEGSRIVSTVRGDVEVPINPKRVVILENGFGDVLALGIIPVAVNDHWAIEGSAIEDLLKDIPRVNDMEEIMLIEPDLIITSFEKDSDYEKLSKIAPTVTLGNVKDSINKTPEERLTFLSELFSIEDSKKQEVLLAYNRSITDAKKKLQEAGITDQSVTILSNTPEEVCLIVSTYKGARALYDDLGIARSEKGQEIYESEEWYAILSLEVLADYCGDYLIIYTYSDMPNAYAGNGVFDNIEAVKNGRVVMMPETLANFDDVLSVQKQIDFMVESLISLP